MLIRAAIPSLDDLHHPAVSPVILKRSFSFGRERPIRLCRGESLTLSVSITKNAPRGILLSLVTNIDAHYTGQLFEVPFKPVNGGRFACEIQTRNCGVFIFRTKYSLDGGESWVFDTVPFSRVIVDPPGVLGLKLYTLIPTVSGDIDSWKRKLSHICDLGFNAVHLLPVTHLDKSESPYSAYNLFNVDPSYLSQGDTRSDLEQFEDFVETAKSLGLRLCFDLVFNHVGVTSQIASRNPEWIVPDPEEIDGFKRAGCWEGYEWTTWYDLALLNYDHPDDTEREALWTYMSQYALFWGNYADYTGGLVRFDNLHSSNPEFIGTVTRLLRSRYPELILLAEFFSDENTLSERVRDWELNLLVATPWEYHFVPQLREYFIYLHRVASRVRYLSAISSHDSKSPAEAYASAEATVPRYVCAALLGCGATGMVQGVESGVAKKVKFIGRKGALPELGKSYSHLIRRVNMLLSQYVEFHRPGNCIFIDEQHAAIISALRHDGSRTDRYLLVAANFDIHKPHELEIDLKRWLKTSSIFSVRELISDRALGSWSNSVTIPLAACQAGVFLLSQG